MEGVLPRPDVAPLMSEHFVGLAADADASEDEVLQLAMRLEGAMMLPFVIFTDADGTFLTGYSGAVTPPHLLKTVTKLVGAARG